MLNLDCFGTSVKKLRESLGLSQKDLAEKIGVTPNTISAYEKKIKFPSLKHAIEIANSLYCSLDALCGEQNNVTLNTYSDVIRMLTIITDIIPSRIEAHSDTKAIIYTDSTMKAFLDEWQKIRELYINNTIDPYLYTAWIEKKLKDYNVELKI